MLPVSDPYCYPGTTILRNLRGIRDPDELAAFEATIVTLNLGGIAFRPIKGPFNIARLAETHRRVFDGVYPWAGELRQNTGMLKKQRTATQSVTYCASAFIPQALDQFFGDLKAEDFLRNLAPTQFAARAAHVYGELDAIHPFREGNSRTLRQFFGDLAHAAGYTIAWAPTPATEEDRTALYLARDTAVMRGDSSLLAKIIEQNLTRHPRAKKLP